MPSPYQSLTANSLTPARVGNVLAAAGSLNMHWLRFTIGNAIGAALWVGFWGALAYWLGKGIFQYLAELEIMEPALLIAACIALAAGILYVIWHGRRQGRADR